MIKSKIYKIIDTFSIPEINRLLNFYASEIAGGKGKAVLLLNELCEIRKKGDAPKLLKDNLWHLLYDTEPYDDQRFRKVCTDALQLIERFLSTEAFLSDRLLESTTRLLALSDKSLEPLYKTHLSRVKTLSDRWPTNDANFYYHQYKIELSEYEMSHANEARFKVANIDRILASLDIFYIIEKLRLHCEVLSRKTFVKHEYRNRLITEILSMINDGEMRKIPVISIYYQIVLTHLEPEEEDHYFDLNKKLQESAHLLTPEHMKEVYYSALNYCARKINQGKESFLRESFDLYKELLRKELLYVDGYLSQWTFKNVVVLALRLSEYEWAETFIGEMQQKIKPKHLQNAVTYNLATLHFYQKDYQEVLKLLQAVEYDDVTYNLGAKTMLLATYFEQDEYDALQNLGDSFRAFINRRKLTIPEGRRRSYLNLIKFTLKLSNLSEQDIRGLDKLKKQVESTKEIASEQWIKLKLSQRIDTIVS